MEQAGMADHSVVSRVKRLTQCRRSNRRRVALTSSEEQLIGGNQDCTDNSFTRAMKPQPECENVEETCHKIAKVIQTFPELRFQVPGARNFAIATIKDTEGLKNSRADDDADIIAAH